MTLPTVALPQAAPRSAGAGPGRARPRSLPLVTLYLTERCNSRCVSCDYWRHGRQDMSLDAVRRWLPGFATLGTRVILFSGGEPLLHPQWPAIAQLLRAQGLELWLLTAGLSLAKHAEQVSVCFASVTVSLDGTCPATYAAIRGLDAFDTVCEGIRALANRGVPVGVRVTVQRANYRELPRFVRLARECGAASVSFLAADVSNPHAFGRQLPGGFADDIALRADDLPALEGVLERIEREQAADFESGFIAESPAKLRRILAYYRALCGHGAFPPVRCNAPEFSAVIEAGGALRPCFFIPGPGVLARDDLAQACDDPALRALRADIAAQRRGECARCVCSMWRELDAPAGAWGARA